MCANVKYGHENRDAYGIGPVIEIFEGAISASCSADPAMLIESLRSNAATIADARKYRELTWQPIAANHQYGKLLEDASGWWRAGFERRAVEVGLVPFRAALLSRDLTLSAVILQSETLSLYQAMMVLLEVSCDHSL